MKLSGSSVKAKTSYRGTMVAPAPPVKDIADLFCLGANLIRVQTIVGDVDPVQWCVETKAQFDYIKNSILPLCGDHRRVVVDIHTPPGGLGPAPDYNAMVFDDVRTDLILYLREAWDYATQLFKDDPRVIAYDVLNEPRCKDVNKVHWLMDHMYNFIRERDTKKKIIISPPYGDPSYYKTFAPIGGTNLWYTLHFYLTDRFTAQGIDGKPTPYHYPARNFDKAKLKSWLMYARKFQLKTGMPMYVGEFSTSIYTPSPDGENYIKDLTDIFEEYGWQWTFHAWRESNVWNPERSQKFLKVLTDKWKKNRV